MQAMSLIRLIAASITLVAASSAAAQSSLLDALPADTQDAISRICLPVQFREGASAYRNCVQSELDLYQSGGSNALGDLSFDDKYAVQQACASAGAQSSQAYQGCVSSQISALRNIRAPQLDKLSEDELYVVQQSCFSAQSEQGAAKYRECLNNEVDSLLAIPAADTSRLDTLKRNALQLRCSSQTSTAVRYRQCVAAEFESIAGRPPSFLPVSTATAIAPARATEELAAPATRAAAAAASTPAIISAEQVSKPTMALPRNIKPPTNADAQTATATLAEQTIADNSTDSTVLANANEATQVELVATPEQTPKADNSAQLVIAQNTNDQAETNNAANIESAQTRVISRPDLADTLVIEEAAPAQQTVIEPIADEQTTTTDANNTSATGGIQEQLAGLWQNTVDKASSMSRTGWLIIAGVLALPALLLGLFSLSNRVEKSRQIKRNTTALAERIEPGLQTRRLRQEREAAELFGDEPSEPMAQSSTDQTEPFADHDAPTRLAIKPAKAEQPEVSPEAKATSTAQPTGASKPLEWQSAFGQWLMQQPADERLHSCIEFLVYWVAYGDERYHQDLRKRLFTATELSTHDQIKRWVLKQDVMAFSDVIGWMQREATPKQLDQSVALIMALLITENGITPVQNTLLRFLSDAFNLGIGRVEKRFERAFGHKLPPIPRPDKHAWWENQPAGATELWDARNMATKPEHEQMMSRLGLQANYDEAQVIQAFRRAARRCHPDRFTDLGNRERAMAEQQFVKFEQARDKLLGVSV